MPEENEIPRIRPKSKNRFHEAIVLYLVGIEAATNYTAVKTWEEPAIPSLTSDGEAAIFQHFVDKLSQICDSRIGGETTTSTVVLQDADRVTYLLASNLRTGRELKAMEQFVADVLNGVEELRGLDTQEGLRHKKDEIFRRIISFNFPRLWELTKMVRANTKSCLTALGVDRGQNDRMLRSVLSELDLVTESLDFGVEHGCGSDESDADADAATPDLDTEAAAVRSFRKSECRALILHANAMYKRGHQTLIRSPMREGERGSEASTRSCWTDLSHALGRLHSYGKAVGWMEHASRQFPELFVDFEVRTISSFPERPASDKQRLPTAKQRLPTAKQLLGRFRSRADGEEQLRADAAASVPNLDAAITAQWHFDTKVHAEVALLDHLANSGGGTAPDRFFRRFGYVGCSKGPCRLCELYFEAHDRLAGGDESYGPVRIRPAHGVFYHKWRVPDLAATATARQVERAEQTLLHMRDALRTEIERTFRTRAAFTRKRDSNTDSSSIPPPGGTGSRATAGYGDSWSVDGLSVIGEDGEGDDAETWGRL